MSIGQRKISFPKLPLYFIFPASIGGPDAATLHRGRQDFDRMAPTSRLATKIWNEKLPQRQSYHGIHKKNEMENRFSLRS
ncbi:hypothetical protein CEXT_359911 [Caerostris extrusa]|uniref:Uncharacterized protein n=1 Tax=Caerostris extrusa TaxID=172846 RepID=A0AAV4NHF0_CAEEX|nr:hypothetical protein CEXT_359911 [Caerostris extrusa]